jgi:hypothetical protein
VESSFGSWRVVTVDSFFTSAALAEELLKKGITITVTVHFKMRAISQVFPLLPKIEECLISFG